jgi:hypothetical protein
VCVCVRARVIGYFIIDVVMHVLAFKAHSTARTCSMQGLNEQKHASVIRHEAADGTTCHTPQYNETRRGAITAEEVSPVTAVSVAAQ